MSIFFRNICLLLWVFSFSHNAFAQEKEFNPVFVDTFLIQNSQDATLQALAQKNDVTNISSKPQWD
jgi:hypothetical protein